MKDEAILSLLLAHDEAGLEAIMQCYGTRLHSLAAGIVGQASAEECVNDALLAAWNAIPPEQPAHLFAYFSRLTRNAALNRHASESAQKRGGGMIDAAIDELAECLPSGANPAQEVEAAALEAAINRFLQTLPKRTRNVFLARYYFAMPLREIAARFAMPENTVKTSLHRTREKLRAFLESEDLL